MKRIIKIFVFLIVLTAVLSCSTLSEKAAKQEALKITDLMNEGKTDNLIKISRMPFLFETEILSSDKLMRTLWNGLKDAGYRIKNPVVSEIIEAGPDTWKIFADTWEAQIYYKKYAPGNAFIIRVKGDDEREIVFLLNRDKQDDYKIAAWRIIK
jgi:hypothetical protein